MATNYLVLGQVNPASATPTTLYTVPSATQAVVSSVVVCNWGDDAGTFRLSVRPDGAAASPQHNLVYDADLSANQTMTLTLGITLGDTDVVTTYASTASFAFSAFGSEIA